MKAPETEMPIEHQKHPAGPRGRIKLFCLLSLLLWASHTVSPAHAQSKDAGMDTMRGSHADHSMNMDMTGMVMNSNEKTLPRSCKSISRDISIKVHVGRKYAKQGQTFGYSDYQWRVPRCARVKVTLINEDQVRHQWMMHGLPRYLYAMGMFHLETNGGTSRSGTFIVPDSNKSYLVHCDMAQHMEKGLKGIFKVGSGSGDLPSVPTISDGRIVSGIGGGGGRTWPETLILVLSSLFAIAIIWFISRRTAKRATGGENRDGANTGSTV